MLKFTKEKMLEYKETLPPSSDRAQCINIANLVAGKSIAEAIANDHRSLDGALRAARLMVEAGCAKGCFGTFVFEDGSILN